MIDKFKIYIMSIIKVINFYQEVPYYNLKSLYFLVVILTPFIPTVYYVKTLKNTNINITIIVSLLVYLTLTITAMVYVFKTGKRWKKKEYETLKFDSVIFTFLFIQIIYSISFLTFFYLIHHLFIPTSI